jgi:tRNA-specific 2-thiouridylase
MELVREYGISDYEAPGGGCLLTDEHFSKKMRDFIKYDKFEVKDIPVLKYGRHLRLSGGAKLVVGRDKDDNEAISQIENDKFIHVKTDGLVGPHSLLSKNASQEDRDLAAKVILTYCKTSADQTYNLKFEDISVESSPFESRKELESFFL